jgi:Raf kinase inhibitor-like YbhB/YbcL family protein
MGKFILWFLIPVLIIAGYAFYTYKTTGYMFGLDQTIFSKGSISITTQDFADGGKIPSDFTCDGLNLNPTFLLEHVPDYSKGLAVILEDSDSKPKNFTHWLAFNISPYSSSIEKSKVLGNAIVGTNDYGNAEYDGPCPPAGEMHKYYFRIYALDTTLNLDENAKRSDLNSAMKGHIIAAGEISGTYIRIAN